jgi:SAM-dependent methyltransferase
VAGIEADAARARAVADRLGVRVEHALVEESRWPDASCDVVYHCDLLSHFPDPVRALTRMRRMLRPDGAMFFEVGLVGGLSPAWYRRMPAGSWPRHRWFYDQRSLAALLDRVGLRVARLQAYSLGPQVLLCRGTSRMLELGRRLLRRHEPACSRPLATAPRERPAEARINNWLRFGLGRVAPRLGPGTALVLAVRRAGVE